jgi:excisionase family DNA binding protein
MATADSISTSIGSQTGPLISIGEAARILGCHIDTVRRYAKSGVLPCYRMGRGKRRFMRSDLAEFMGEKTKKENISCGILAYIRTSTGGQAIGFSKGDDQNDLARQKARIQEYCQENYGAESKIFSDVGSGLSYETRKAFKRLFIEILSHKHDGSILIVENKDRLCRFGNEVLSWICNAHSIKLVFTDKHEETEAQELAQDLLNIIHVFSSRSYGLRAAIRLTKKLSPPVVERIKQLRNEGLSISAITKALHNEGLRTEKNEPITYKVAKRILGETLQLEATNDNSSIERYYAECIVKSASNLRLAKSAVFDDYVQFCKREKLTPASVHKVGKLLNEKIQISGMVLPGGKTTACYCGVYIKSNPKLSMAVQEQPRQKTEKNSAPKIKSDSFTLFFESKLAGCGRSIQAQKLRNEYRAFCKFNKLPQENLLTIPARLLKLANIVSDRQGGGNCYYNFPAAQKCRELALALRFESLEDRRMLAVLTVDSVLDNFNPAAPTSDGVITLREAILAANTDTATGDAPAGSGLDQIAFAVDGTIQLASQLPTITADLSIDGGGRSIIIAGAGGTGGGGYRIIEFNDGNAGNQIVVSLNGLTLTGGNTSSFGGAIANAENLSITSTTIWNNFTTLSGGGISNTGTLQMTNATISNNKADLGGGGLYNTGTANLESLTVFQNDSGFGNGGGILNGGMTLSLNNSAFSLNTRNGSPHHVSGTLASGSSFNFFDRGGATGGLMHGVNGNIVGNGAGGFLSAGLSTLDYYGGPVLTQVPLTGSPLLDNGDDAVGTASDARGAPFLRNDGNGVDIGAVERQSLAGLSLVVDVASDTFDGDYSAGNLSLREAVGLANGSVGADVITFGALFDSPQTIAVGSQFRVMDDVTIDGAGKLVTLDAGGGATASPGDGHRIFLVDDGVASNTLQATLRGLTLTGGDPASNNLSGQGGAIFNVENLTLVGSTLNNNSSIGRGGGIWSSNQLTVENSTFSANSAGSQGGGIFHAAGSLNFVSSTLTLNSSATQGGGIYITSGTVAVNSSIVAGNTAASNADVSGTISTDTFNVIGGDPLLGPLADNGGPTRTHALSLANPALNAGDPAITTGTDQRGTGFGRVEVGRADIGAFEYQEANLPASLIVSNTGDTIDDDQSFGELTLREAIRIANLRPGADTIDFDPTLFATPQTIATGSMIDISDAVTITGPGQDLLTIDGGLGGDGLMNGNGHTLLRITSSVGGAYDVDISGLVLTGGDGTGFGGAIFSSANLLLSEVTVQNNAGLSVGGITMLSGTTITVEDSLFAGNLARSGSIDDLNTGAIQGRNINILRSTFAENQTTFGAGAVNAVSGASVLNITDSTFHDNTGSLGASAVRTVSVSANIVNSTFSANENGLGAIVQSGSGTMNISHSTFAESTLDDLRIFSGTANVTHSILESVNGTLATSTFNLIGGNAMLGPLADNGGPTLTRALLPGSSAIDAGDPAAMAGMGDVPLFDQRGMSYTRVAGGRIDIGAFELQSAVLPGDFDLDGDVDGRDFLMWQRGGSPTQLSASDLNDWQDNYGTTLGPLVATLAIHVPDEPESLLVSTTEDPFTSYRAAIDAALALSMLGEAEDRSEAVPISVPSVEQEANFDLAFENETILQRRRATEEVDFEFDDSNGTDEIPAEWLAEEMLERVFG